MHGDLRNQKLAVVREALYDSAIELFARNGFDETTVEAVAEAAGVSRRTFFRYFDSKDDLLAHAIVSYTRTLVDAVEAAPPGASPFEVVTEIVLATARYTDALGARTQQVMKIAERSASARQAYLSRMINVEDSLANALAIRFGHTSSHELRPRLVAGVTLLVMNSTITSWFRGEHANLMSAARCALSELQTILCDRRPKKTLKSPIGLTAPPKTAKSAAALPNLKRFR
ncbi:MAG: hypothetical protein DMG68_21055 [Acidobacteria bacterium]|nr:MAG: hypothetical protein DMG68_21055 [Acidobacteriota bacterium]